MEYKPVQLFYEEFGEGTPVVLLHGFPLDHSTWKDVVPLISEKARIILPDLRGHGMSPVSEGVYQMRLLAEDIVFLLDKLKIEKAVLVGHSMGGYISLAFAQAYPQRLSGLGLVATQAAADSPEKRQARLITVDDVKRRGVKAMAKKHAQKLSDKEDTIEYLYNLVMKTSPVAIIGSLKGMAERPDSTPFLSEIQVPTVVISGKLDKGIPPEQPQTMTRLIPRSWLVEIESGHMAMLEDPQAVARALGQLVDLVKN